MKHCRSLIVLLLTFLLLLTFNASVLAPPVAKACDTCNFQLAWGSTGSGTGQFGLPGGIAVDSAGNVYVVDAGNNRVEKFTSTGIPVTAWGCANAFTTACPSSSGNGQFYVPIDVAVDSSGNVYVTDSGIRSVYATGSGNNNRVEKFTSTGTFLGAWGSTGSGTGQFGLPGGVAVDSAGNVYVIDFGNSRVEKFTSAGIFLLTWGSSGSGNGQFSGALGVAVDASGNVYITDSDNNRVEKFTSTGTFLLTLGSTGSGSGQFIRPRSVAVDSAGNVYVVDAGNNRVEKFTSTGIPVTAWGCANAFTTACPSYGTGNGQFYDPGGVAVDSSGNVYVTDSGINNRVEKFGDAVTVATSSSTMTSSLSVASISSTTSQCIPTATANACLAASAGMFSGLTTSAVSSIPTPPPAGLTFPYGLFSFTISGLSAGQTTIVTITLSSSLPNGAFSYWEFQGGSWTEMSSSRASLDSTRTIITLTLTASNDTVVDLGGPAITPATTTSSSMTLATASTIASRTTSVGPASTSTSALGTLLVSVNPLVFAPVGAGMLAVVLLVGALFVLRVRSRRRTTGAAPLASTKPPASVGGVSPEAAEKLQRLRRMLDLGLITQEDYEEQSKRLGAG